MQIRIRALTPIKNSGTLFPTYEMDIIRITPKYNSAGHLIVNKKLLTRIQKILKIDNDNFSITDKDYYHIIYVLV
jgi:hypothetical protein